MGLLILATTMRVAGEREWIRRASILGAATGAALLTREVLIVLVPLVALAFAQRVAARYSIGAAVRAGAAIVLVAASMAAGWSLLQSARAGRTIGISEKGPLVLAYGNNPRANGTFNANLAGVGEPSGWAFIRAEPAHAMRLAGRKVLYFSGLLRDGWNVPRPSAIWASRATAGSIGIDRFLPWARGGWIFAALLIALTLWPRSAWRVWWTLPAAIALVMLVHIITVASHRFAVPILPLAFVVIAGPIARAVDGVWRRPAWRAVMIAAVLAIAGMQVIDWPMRYRVHAADMDGAATATTPDRVTGEITLTADAARRVSPVLTLIDEWLPAGSFTIGIAARASQSALADAPALRVIVATLDGTQVCVHDVRTSALAPDSTSLPCAMPHGGPATLTIETMVTTPVQFGDVTLTWGGGVATSGS